MTCSWFCADALAETRVCDCDNKQGAIGIMQMTQHSLGARLPTKVLHVTHTRAAADSRLSCSQQLQQVAAKNHLLSNSAQGIQ